jgi:hypothetical protein
MRDTRYEVRCPACGYRWYSTSFSGRTTCAECRTRVYVPVADRPAHVAQVGRQLRRGWRDRATTTAERHGAALQVRWPTPSPTVWPDDDAGYYPDDWDDDDRGWDDERNFDDEDETDRRGDERRAPPSPATRQPSSSQPRSQAAIARAPSRGIQQTPTRSAHRPPMGVLYVAPDQHAPAVNAGTRCPHALALPINVVLPVLARCDACGATEHITGGSQLTAVMVPADAQPARIVKAGQ